MRDLDEELKDPRIGIDKEKGKDKEKSMSPEAQKIASTDEKSIEAKAKAMPKIEVDVSDKIAILGKSGSGKTNLIKVLISDVLKDYQFVLLDALGNFSEYEGKPNVEYHQITPTDEATVDDIIYSALERGNCMVVMDEIDRYKSKPGSMVNELVNLGRNYGVGGIFAARRTADVNKDILANSPFIFTFQHILPQDLDVLIDWFAQPEEVFRDLQEYEAILFKDGEQAWQGKVPEKPTTKPTAKPRQPKKPKGKDKDKDGKDSKDGSEKEPEPKEKEPKEPEEPEEPEAPPEEEPAEEPPEEKPPEEEKTEEKERVQWCAGCGGQFQTGRELHNHQKETGDSGTIEGTMEKGEERPFKCDQCPEAYKYEKDFLNHIVEKHS
jgi:energy-coupling factor transporter ATP-binding protein EcfA2